MRIRVKRAGWLLVVGALVVVLCVVVVRYVRSIYLRRDISLPSFAAEGFSAKRQVTTGPTQTDRDLLAAASSELNNVGFENGFKPVPAPRGGQLAKISGNLPNGWFDLSQWSDLDVHYDEDRRNPHSGTSCLRIDLGDVRRQEVLLTQPLKLAKNKTYAASIWLRAAQPTTVNFGLRMRGKPYRYYGESSTKIDTNWQKVETIATITDDRYPFVYFLIEIYSPNCTVWIDDAHIEEASPGAAVPAAASAAPAPNAAGVRHG